MTKSNTLRGVKARPPKPRAGVLPKIRDGLSTEIRVAQIMTATYSTSDYFKGRLDGLMWVRDHLLFNMKED